MLKVFWKILPLFIFVWLVRRIKPTTHWTEHGGWYMPYRDVLVRIDPIIKKSKRK